MRLVRTLPRNIVLALALLSASQGAAATMVYDEATDGDAGAAYLPPPNGVPDVILGLGTSTIKGTTEFGFGFLDEFYDDFRLVLAPNTVITGLSVTVNAPVGTGIFSNLGWVLSNNGDFNDPAYQQFGTVFNNLTAPGTALFSGGLPVPAGPLVFGTASFSGLMSAGESSTVDYEINLTVAPAPVPLPATLPLLAGALGLLAWRRRRAV